MPRSHRDFTTDNRFHVVNHGVDGQDLFSIEDDWLLFESLIGRACNDHGFRLNAYALMSNHFHLLADLSDCDDRAGVSVGIGVLESTYAKYFNDRTSRRGPLFEPRFLSFGVDGDTRTHRVIRYIHRNPVDISGRRRLGAYRWSSLPVYLGRRESPDWLDSSLFEPQDPAAYLSDLAACHADDLWPLDDLAPQHRVSIDDIETAVTQISTSTVDRQTHETLVLMLAVELRTDDIVTIAERFGRSESTIRRRVHAGRTRRHDEPSFARMVERIELFLTRS